MTIGDQFELKMWNYVTGRISVQQSIELNKDKRALRQLQILCCDVKDGIAYLALNSNEIMVYSIQERRTLITHAAWKEEEVIFIKGIKTYENTYVLIVYRTASILYRVRPNFLEEESIYIINSKKSPSYKADVNSKH